MGQQQVRGAGGAPSPGTTNGGGVEAPPIAHAIVRGDTNAVRTALRNGTPVETTLGKGNTLLHVAAHFGKADIVNLLIESGAKVDAKNEDDDTPFALALRAGHNTVALTIIEAMGRTEPTALYLGALLRDVIAQEGGTRRTESSDGDSQQAPSAGVENLLEILTARGEAGQGTDRLTETDKRLHGAVISGSINEIVDLIDNHGANVNAPDKDSDTPLHNAAYADNDGVIEELVKRGAVKEARNKRGMTPLHIAAGRGNLGAVKMLVKHGVDIKAKDRDGDTALAIAAMKGSLDIAECLVDAGSPIDEPDNRGSTALWAAALAGHIEIVRLLLRHGADAKKIGAKGGSTVYVAAQNGHAAIVKLLLEYGANPEIECDDHITPIIVASYRGYLDTVKVLVEAGVKVNAVPQGDLCSALYVACQNGHFETAVYLMENGANLSQRTAKQATPAHVCVVSGNMNILEELLRRGVSLEETDKDGDTPLLLAIMSNKLDIAMHLLQLGANHNAERANGCSAIYVASERGQLEIVKALHEKGADRKKKSRAGPTPLWIAALKGHADILQYYIDCGATLAELEVTSAEGDTPLLAAAIGGNTAVVQVLIAAGVNLEARRSNGCTALYIAAEKNVMEMLLMLLDAGAVVDAPNKNDVTPLWIAAFGGHLDIARELVRRGAKLDSKDKMGNKTPQEIALVTKHHDVSQFLEAAARDRRGAVGGSNVMPATVHSRVDPSAPMRTPPPYREPIAIAAPAPSSPKVAIAAPTRQPVAATPATRINPANRTITRIAASAPASRSLEIDDIAIDKSVTLGRGGMGDVYAGMLRSTGEPIAVKVIKLNQHGGSHQAELDQELRALCEVATGQCRYIVHMFGSNVDATRNEALIVMERADSTLAAEIAALGGAAPDPLRVARVAMQITLALKYLHTPRGEDGNSGRWLHLDLKPQQILLFNDGTVAKLCDFSIAASTNHTMTLLSTAHGTAGTTNYKAPEQFRRNKEKGPFTDVYGLGALLWQWLRGGQQPWTGYDPTEISGEVAAGNGLVESCGPAYPGVAAGQPLPASVSEGQRRLAELVARCLQLDATRRPSVDDIVVELKRIVEVIENEDE